MVQKRDAQTKVLSPYLAISFTLMVFATISMQVMILKLDFQPRFLLNSRHTHEDLLLHMFQAISLKAPTTPPYDSQSLLPFLHHLLQWQHPHIAGNQSKSAGLFPSCHLFHTSSFPNQTPNPTDSSFVLCLKIILYFLIHCYSSGRKWLFYLELSQYSHSSIATHSDFSKGLTISSSH